MKIDDYDEAVAECRRLATLSGRAVVPGEELDRITGYDLPDVVVQEAPATFYVSKRLYPLPRERWDEEFQAEMRATDLDRYRGIDVEYPR